MTWWKFIYDAKTPTWQAYGRIAFVQAATEADANQAGLAFAHADYPGSAIVPIAIGQSTPEAAAAYFQRRTRLEQWKRNATEGIPNTRGAI